MRRWANLACGSKTNRRAGCPKICAANVARRCANWMNRNWPTSCARPPASVFKPRPRNSTPARNTPAGNRRLWEGLFRALGYKHNVWPMQNLAESRARWARGADSAFGLQARLLGISGLLPAELTRAQAGDGRYLRRVWDCWWRERDEFGDCLLPRAVWKFHGLRPANHPQRRLALAAHWLAAGNLIAKTRNTGAPADSPDNDVARFAA